MRVHTSPERKRRVKVGAPRAVFEPALALGARTTDPALALGARAGRRAFTLIEVLVVIVVIGILIAAIGLVGSRAVHSQKIRATESIMKNVKLAIDQFATADPLAAIYDRKDARTFGPYPPYQLAACSGVCVSGVLEPANSLPGDYTLGNRLHRDMGNRVGNVGDWVSWGTMDPGDGNLDNRALYTYLKLYAADVLAQVPNTALKPLTGTAEYVNPTGTGPPPGQLGSAWVDVLGIYDAWGVPLDYFLYVKLEHGMDGWKVTDRVPVLRSWGISYEEYQAELAGTDVLDPEKWIFSDPFPAPAAAAVDPNDGTLSGTGARVAGWARAKAVAEHYGYVP